MHAIFVEHLERLGFLHAEILSALDGLPPAALDWSPGPAINSLAVLTTHVIGAERYWIGEQVGGRAAHRVRADEFEVHHVDPTKLSAGLNETLQLTAEVLAALTPADLERPLGLTREGYAYNGAWALLHALEHTAQHSGHIQLMRQWWKLAAGQ